jgi:hypothetical protein
MIDCEEAILDRYGISYQDWQISLNMLKYPHFENATLINEVHDELTWDLPPKTMKEDQEIILGVMSRPPTLRKLIPEFNITFLKVEPKVSDRW